MSETLDAPDGHEVASVLSLSEFLPYRVVALGHLLSRRLARAYAGENISVAEWRVLAVISQAQTMAARDVVARTPMDKMAVSRAVAALEGKGLIRRQPDRRDRRVATLALSAPGRALFARVASLARAYEDWLLAALAPDDRRDLLALLDKIEARAAAPGPDALSPGLSGATSAR
jgi:DNA-binding MarR family transcriptional regulator